MQTTFLRGGLAGAAMLVLAGCGTGSYTLGGTASGLRAGEGVELLNNGGEALTVSGNGGFSFARKQTTGTTYDISVESHTPGITCSVTNGTGTVGSSNITSVIVSCGAGTESILYSFKGGPTDGQGPSGSLIMDSAGNFYGTTAEGGANGYGTVFRIDTAGAETVLHSFAGGPIDGQQPQAGLSMDSAGNLYGTTEYGGANNCGTVFKIDTASAETVLYSFAGGTADGQQPQAGLIMDSAGNLYGTTTFGGADRQGTVFKVSATGVENVLYSFKGHPTDGAAPTGRLLMDSAGNFYGTTEGYSYVATIEGTSVGGAANNNGTVFELSATGTESVLYSFSAGTTDGLDPFPGLIMDSAGNLHGTPVAGGANGYGTAFKLN